MDKLSRNNGKSYASAISWKERAYLLKFYDQSTHVLEGLEPFFSRMLTFEMILVLIQGMRTFLN